MALRDFGLFVPTTDIFDVSYIQQLDVNTPEFKELIIRLQQRTNQIALALNLKESAIYPLDEFLTSQTFFPNPALSSTTAAAPIYRQGYRKVVLFGPLPNAGTIIVPHGIPVNATYTFTRIYGTGNDHVNLIYIPLPFASPVLNENVKVIVDATTITIETASDFSDFTDTIIVLEYFIG